MKEHQCIFDKRPFQFIVCFFKVDFGNQEISFPSLVVDKMPKFLRKDVIIFKL